MKPFTTYFIDRYSDVALVTIVRISKKEDGNLKREVLEEYETLGKGATASAKRAIKKIEKGETGE